MDKKIKLRGKNSTRPLVITGEILKGRVILPKALESITQGSHITYYSLMFFIAYAFKDKCMFLQDEWKL